MGINWFPPEEGIICDWLIKELADAKSWEQIHVIMRALANVRRLGEEERAKQAVPSAPRAPVPAMPPALERELERRRQARISRAQLPPSERHEDGTFDIEGGSTEPWETDPETM